jgi:hypothetical protein
LDGFAAVLDEIDALMSRLPGRTFILGMDGNTKVAKCTDRVHIGRSVLPAPSDTNHSQRASLIHELFVKYGIRLLNALVDFVSQDEVATCFSWPGNVMSHVFVGGFSEHRMR